MIERQLSADLLNALRHMPVVALLGPRQVGKTTLALEVVEAHDSPEALPCSKPRTIKQSAETQGHPYVAITLLFSSYIIFPQPLSVLLIGHCYGEALV